VISNDMEKVQKLNLWSTSHEVFRNTAVTSHDQNGATNSPHVIPHMKITYVQFYRSAGTNWKCFSIENNGKIYFINHHITPFPCSRLSLLKNWKIPFEKLGGDILNQKKPHTRSIKEFLQIFWCGHS
jgi:hypothetical protein